jgi:glycine/D-amino acid oxidase-like deaminating enzyme
MDEDARPDDYAGLSFWLAGCGDDLAPRPALDGSERVDVAILGAGYTGLWTAYYLLRAEPSLRVAVLEAEIAGFGASGRNGAWCAPGLNISLSRLARLHGPEAARRTYLAVDAAVEEIGRVARDEGLDIEWRRGGQLTVARGAHEEPAVRAELAELERFRLADGYELLDAGALRARIDVGGGTLGLYTPAAAAIQPAKLARSLARTVTDMGVRLYERTTVTDVRARGTGNGSGGGGAALVTERGEVTADSVVLAGEAYLCRLPRLHRALIPVWSQIVLSEPLPADEWERIGWRDHELIGSPRLTVVYLSRTSDGRIVFGGRGAPYRFGSVIRDEYGRHEGTFAMLRELAGSWFPQLRRVGFSHAWGGALGMPRDWHPTIEYDPRTGLGSARGYVGHGVATSNLAGRTLAELIMGQASERTELPLVNHRSRDWEPEPLRWLGVRYVQAALARLDRRAERSGRAPTGRTLAERIARH